MTSEPFIGRRIRDRISGAEGTVIGFSRTVLWKVDPGRQTTIRYRMDDGAENKLTLVALEDAFDWILPPATSLPANVVRFEPRARAAISPIDGGSVA